MASRPFTIVEVLYILHTLILRFSLLKVRYIPARQSYLQSQGEVRGLPSTTIIFFLSFSAFNFPEILLGLGRGGGSLVPVLLVCMSLLFMYTSI